MQGFDLVLDCLDFLLFPFSLRIWLATALSNQRCQLSLSSLSLSLSLKQVIVCAQVSRRASLGGNASHPVLALFSGQPIRTTKVMYAHIKGIPIVKESWLLACVSAHKLLPFDALHLEGGMESEGHQAFQGLRLHLAGSPGFMQSFGRLIQHAGRCTHAANMTGYLHWDFVCMSLSETAMACCAAVKNTDTHAVSCTLQSVRHGMTHCVATG